MIPLALLAALFVVGLNTWFAIAAIHALLQSESWTAHTWEVIGQEKLIMNTMLSAESSMRGYVVTGRDDSLGTLHRAQVDLPGQLQHFKDITLDNPVQQANLAEMHQAIDDRLKLMEQTVQARQQGGFEAAQTLASTGRGNVYMDRVRFMAGKMEDEERRLLTNRAEESRQNGTRAYFAIALACVLDLLMIGFVTYYFVQERQLRLASELTSERLAVARAQAERSAEQVRMLNADLEQRVRDRTAELESTNRELEAFSYSVSHDLRAPLRTIDGFSLALQEDYADVVDATGRDYISRVRAGVQRMGGLIDALLQLSRITRAEVVREQTNPAAIAENVMSALKEENPDRNIRFTVFPGPDASADPKLVQVALENLLGNAVKFTSRREHAEIEFGWDETQNAWRVCDNGAGFDMHYADKLFNAFNRLHGDKDFKGSGIGLATVARVIRRHGGRIWADSTVDHGASFWFTLG